jgi:hypothetical protein
MAVQFEVAEDETLARLLAHQYPVRGSEKGLGDDALPEGFRRAA